MNKPYDNQRHDQNGHNMKDGKKGRSDIGKDKKSADAKKDGCGC